MNTLKKIQTKMNEIINFQDLLSTVVINSQNDSEVKQAKETLDEIIDIINSEIIFGIEDDLAFHFKELDMCLYKKPFFENILRHQKIA